MDDVTQVSLGPSGDAAAAWFDNADGGRLALARKPAGAAWSAPAGLGPVDSGLVDVGVDAAGDMTAAYNSSHVLTITNWAASAASPTTTPIAVVGGIAYVNDIAVNAAGDAVVAGTSIFDDGTPYPPAEVVVGYRHGFGGAFDLHRYTYAEIGLTADNPRVAINAAGMAVVAFIGYPHLPAGGDTPLLVATRAPGSEWGPAAAAEPAVLDIVPAVAIDGAGNVLAGFTYLNGAGESTVGSLLLPLGGIRKETLDLSPGESVQVQAVVNDAGAALLVWEQGGGDGTIMARWGTTTTGWGAIEAVNDTGADTPVAAIGADGHAAVAWERATGSVYAGQARIREPGPGGAWGATIMPINATHLSMTVPSIAADGLGDFAITSAPDNGTTHPLLLTAYDAAPPALSPIAAVGTMLAGDPTGLSVSATDAWSAVGAPAWTFGDGSTGSGLSVSHTFASAGTFNVHVGVSDASGNAAAGRDITITVSAAQAVLGSAKFTGKWKRSRISGSLVVAGNVPRAGSYAVDLTRGRKLISHFSLTLDAGAYTHSFKLPAKFLPGVYGVALVPSAPPTQVKPASLTAGLAAPPEGVVDVAILSGARNGPAARTLTGATAIWASFHFAALPKGKSALRLTWYRLGKTRTRMRAITMRAAAHVVDHLRPGKSLAGTYEAVLTRKGLVIAQISVRVKHR